MNVLSRHNLLACILCRDHVQISLRVWPLTCTVMCAALLVLSTSQPMQARTETVVVTGMVASGYDTSGVFGPVNTYLDGQLFTLTFKTEDTQGTIVCSSGCSGIYSTLNVNPTTATLQIGTGSYTFGTIPRSNGGANGSSSSIQLNGNSSSNYLAYLANDVLNGRKIPFKVECTHRLEQHFRSSAGRTFSSLERLYLLHHTSSFLFQSTS